MVTNAELLTEAKSALHSLLTGRAIARVRDSNGEEVQYNKADIPALRQYILDLQGLVDTAAGVGRSLGPMRVFF